MIVKHFRIFKVELFSPPIPFFPKPAITIRIVSAIRMMCCNYAKRSPIFRVLVSNQNLQITRKRIWNRPTKQDQLSAS